MRPNSLQSAPVYERIYAVVGQIPAGQVATYGQIAEIVGGLYGAHGGVRHGSLAI